MTSSRSRTGTVQFRRQDVRLFSHGNVLPRPAPRAQLQQADGFRLYLDNQKNSQRGSTMFHSALDQHFCPVKVLVRPTHYLYAIAPEDASLPISSIRTTHHVTTPDINLASSTRATPRRVSVRIPYEPAGPWHSVSTTPAKISSKNSDAGPVLRGSLTFTLK